MNYMCTEAVIPVQWYMPIKWNVVCEVYEQYHMVDVITSYGTHIWAYNCYVCPWNMAYICSFGGLFLWLRYDNIMCEVDIVVYCILEHIYATVSDYMPVHSDGSELFCNVAAIFSQWCMPIRWNEVCEIYGQCSCLHS